MKIYVVIEDYTCAFCGLFTYYEEAKNRAEEVGGSVEEFEI